MKDFNAIKRHAAVLGGPSFQRVDKKYFKVIAMKT